MSADTTVSQTAAHGNGGNKRTTCPLHGCKRVYTDMSALESHIKDHEISAHSLPGKVFLCSTIGCSGSFPNMQKLMEHMRHHHKPNIFFLCESCRTKLRSYRGLLTHLHTCSKVPRSKTKATEPVPPAPAALTSQNLTPVAMDQNPPRLDSSSTPQEQPFQIPNPDSSFPGAAPRPDSDVPPLLGPTFFSNLETSLPPLPPQQLAEAAPQPQLRNDASDPPQSLTVLRAAPDQPDGHGQHQTQTRSPASATQSPPGSSAVWKKSQGLACSRRILWEHTKGRYTCVQCGHMVTNRKEMTQHISSQHSGNKPAEEVGSSATNS